MINAAAISNDGTMEHLHEDSYRSNCETIQYHGAEIFQEKYYLPETEASTMFTNPLKKSKGGDMSACIVIFCTVPSREVGVLIADSVVPDGLAACVNIVGGLMSIYRWRGEICRDEECLLIIKSRRKLFKKIKDRITSIHPYEVPEIVSLPIEDGHEPYLRWIRESTP
jgi:periplasmic divalent cation tolerance protein